MMYCVPWRRAVLLSRCHLPTISTLKGVPVLMMSVFKRNDNGVERDVSPTIHRSWLVSGLLHLTVTAADATCYQR
jgi:hypothetical protein